MKNEYEKFEQFFDRWRGAFTFDGQISSGKSKILEEECTRVIDEMADSGGMDALGFAWAAVGGIAGLDKVVRRHCERKGYIHK